MACLGIPRMSLSVMNWIEEKPCLSGNGTGSASPLCMRLKSLVFLTPERSWVLKGSCLERGEA